MEKLKAEKKKKTSVDESQFVPAKPRYRRRVRYAYPGENEEQEEVINGVME